MPGVDNICVKVSNKEGAKFNEFGNNTYLMKFEKSGGGLNSLHITTNCKTCDIMDPYEIINWVTPEGGGGPGYELL